jgi:segregation and condensation protein A
MEIKIQTKQNSQQPQETEFQSQQFSGPLDLLLQLIEQQQMDITQIALASVTEQFLEHVQHLESKVDATQLADYLSIAAKLLVLKSKQLLPTLEIESEDEEPAYDLEAQLQRYKQFKEAAKILRRFDNRRRQSFARDPGDTTLQRISFYPDPAVTPERLHGSIQAVVQALKEIIRQPEGMVREVISIQDKIAALQERISRQVQTKLSEMLSEAKNKTEVIVTFLALLELTKQRIIVVEQDILFSDIIITYRGDEVDEEKRASEAKNAEAEPSSNADNTSQII